MCRADVGWPQNAHFPSLAQTSGAENHRTSPTEYLKKAVNEESDENLLMKK